ncbi:UDP-N-acetylglucosamine transporter [Reticulomyxa filosa]|uniref:UDP-N-acetylglucosamine transporter n=1 Tax=Reticulomyxa filosa TaxID=46433 RepID=X6PB40_RETFI|nr:UDP-N-acetylglucosamine transporter [Reticulomyxa filosa]|eukprot:ETO35765.1 UDP-N-acetylglucosamine transporter [Reticulomyxa filosa]
MAAVTSGFSGVFVEREFKSSSLWIRNIQLGLFGCISTLANSYFFGDWDQVISKYGFLHAFTFSTWVVVALNVFGGYLVAVLIKEASNQAKAFAAGIAIVLIVFLSKFFFQSQLTFLFFVGLFFTLAANYVYFKEGERLTKPNPTFAPVPDKNSRAHSKHNTKDRDGHDSSDDGLELGLRNTKSFTHKIFFYFFFFFFFFGNIKQKFKLIKLIVNLIMFCYLFLFYLFKEN